MSQDLLALREKIKSHKPAFIGQERHRRDKLEEKWRQPKGIQSKLRRKFKGKRMHPSLGFSSPSKVRFLNRDGMKRRMVANLQDLETIDPKTEVAVLRRSVGRKMRTALLQKALELKVKVENVKDPASFLKSVEEMFNKKKAEKEAAAKKKAKKEEKPAKTEKKEEKQEEKVSAEERKKQEKEEHKKVIEKRQ
ncbi:hypothetical protein HY501_01415 [Candidatus Woesearchaeota archaeon]|nr:hypothetical protein [Candidatus Woesearchaeota archaeon]